ncbi:MAG TPA: NAD(P)-dependent oxidoreductase [Solirubrobacteraceae bacterium]|nr:NAD(P)-dependent oxidoreductase [Solirubrobacteraceae bacterium]
MAGEPLGFIGLGIMGSRMAANLVRAGYDVRAWNRTRETADAWAAEHGGTVAGSPREAADGATAVITMVVDGPQVEQVLLGEDGAAHGAAEGTLFVDMSTIAPQDTRRIGDALSERGLPFVDAPVTGSSPKAEDGTLTIMAGGAEADFARARPYFEAMGEVILHVGELGHGQKVKVISNAVAATNCATLAQALVVGKASGVDLEALLQVFGAGAANSTMVGLKGQPMLRHDYTTLFRLEHMLKDVAICLDESQAAGVPFPAAALARELYAAGMGRGLGDRDFAAVLDVVEGLAGVRL